MGAKVIYQKEKSVPIETLEKNDFINIEGIPLQELNNFLSDTFSNAPEELAEIFIKRISRIQYSKFTNGIIRSQDLDFSSDKIKGKRYYAQYLAQQDDNYQINLAILYFYDKIISTKAFIKKKKGKKVLSTEYISDSESIKKIFSNTLSECEIEKMYKDFKDMKKQFNLLN